MAVQENKGISTKKTKTIIMDQNDDEKRKVEAKGMIDLCKKVRESKFSVGRVIMAIHDPDVASFFQIPPTHNNRDYAMVEVTDSKEFGVRNSLNLKVKMVQGFLNSQGYKCVATKIFDNKEYPLAKIIVKVQ